MIVMASMMAACAAPQAPRAKKDYVEFPAGNPRSILIPPVVNNTVNVDAPRYLLSTIPIPVAARGFYIFPVNLVRGMMNEEGLSDANMVHAADPTVLGALFGADAILYITIHSWETEYLLVTATTTVSFSYVLKSGRTGEELWSGSAKISESSEDGTTQSDDGDSSWLEELIGRTILAAIQTSAPDYMQLAREATGQALGGGDQVFPAGPYSGKYGKD